MLASQKSHRRFVAANHDRPARPALVDVYGASPHIAARHEACVARIMHRVVGLNGKIPEGRNIKTGLTNAAIEARELALADLRLHGPSMTSDVASRLSIQRDKVSYYLQTLWVEGRVSKSQAYKLAPTIWEVEA